MIEISALSHQFGDFQALDKISLQVAPGEFFSFLGCNGAGKTTTIKLLTGLLSPTSGQIRIGGLDYTPQNSRAIKQLVGYIPDRPYVPGKLTAREFLTFVARIFELDEASYQPKIEELLKTFFLEEWGDKLLENFSHGMRQKVVISAALLHDPQLLIIDEPTVGLDPRSIRLIKDKLLEIAKGGVTIFLSTHSLELAAELSDRVGILHHGRLMRIGSIAELQQDGRDSTLEEIFLRLTSEGDQ